MQLYSKSALVLCAALLLSLPLITQANSETSSYQEAAKSSLKTYSLEQLEALIAQLQKQLEELRKGAQCVVSEKNLSIGDGEDDGLNKDIARLQGFLKEKGFFAKQNTGYFGKLTRASLIAFQTNAGISASGEFDAATRTHISTLRCKGFTASNTSVKKIEDVDVKKASSVEQPKVTSISLSNNGSNLKWIPNGYSSQGYKVVSSKNPSPVYPNRDGDTYQYFEKSTTNTATLTAFNGAGTYYVRVCEYLGGSCGVYSNELSIQLQ